MKSHNAAPAYASTTDENLAAALSVWGIPIIPDKSVDSRSGMGWKKILLGLESVPWTEIGAVTERGEEEPLPTIKTNTILGLIRNNKLFEADPHHPSLDVLRACRAADEIAKWTKDGADRVLVKVQGADRYQLVQRPLEPSIKTGIASLGTRDLKMAACLCVLGCQLLRLEGAAPNTLFVFGPVGFGTPPVVPTDLRVAFRNGSLAAENEQHPLLWMMQGLSNRDAIRDMMRKKAAIILIRAPDTGRASLVSENAKGRTMDRVKKHLRIL